MGLDDIKKQISSRPNKNKNILIQDQKDKSFKQINLGKIESAASGAESISAPEPLSIKKVIGRAGVMMRRRLGLQAKSLIGDIPYVRKILPESVKELKPRSGVESMNAGLPRLARDMYVYTKIGGLGGGLKFVAGAAAHGAATADSEDPIEIAKSAATSAALLKTIDLGFKRAPKIVRFAYERLPKSVQSRMSKLGQSIGTSLKKYTDITKAQFKRHADIKVKQLETATFKKDMIEGLPDVNDREALVFMIEKTGVPKGLKDASKISSSLESVNKKPILEHWANQLRTRYDAAKDAMMDTYGKDITFQKDYINRLWEIPKNKEKEVLNWFARKTSHQKKRVFQTVEEGMRKFPGLKPKTLDAAELISYYENNVYAAMANENFIRAASKIKVGATLKSGRTGLAKAIQRADRAPKDWITINHPAVNRAMGVRNKAGKLIIRQSPVKVHPSIAEEMQVLLGSKNEHAVMRAVEGMNAYAKHSSLALSLFHHVALVEAGIATGINTPKAVLESIRQMKQGKSPVLNNPAFKDAIANGLVADAPSDVSRNLVEKSLANLNAKLGKRAITKPIKLATKPLEWIVTKNNKFLWDYLHPNLKLYGYEQGVQSLLKHPKFKNVPVDQVKRSVAQIINDTFGGQSWALLNKSPQWQQSMHLAMLSPDWNLSTVRQFSSIFGSGGRSKIDNAMRQELGSEFWKMGSIILFGGMNQLNKAFTQMHLGEARNMWENEPNHKTHLFLGKNPDGTNNYLRWGKQFREVPEFFMKPVEKTTGKVSPVVRGIAAQSFPNKWSKIPGTEGLENLKERGLEAVKIFTPYSAQNQIRKKGFTPLGFAFPTSKGLTYYKAKEELLKAMRSGNKNRIRAIQGFIAENGHDPDGILQDVIRDSMKTRGTEDWNKARDIYNKLQKVSDQKKYLKDLEKKGKLPQSILQKIFQIKQEKDTAKKKYKAIKRRDK